jgi:CHAT domain-containing protein/tetratricopeptide (TPR) repeat protein
LAPTDPEIRELLHVGVDSCRAANTSAWVAEIEKALQIADNRGLVGDRAVLEAYLASVLIAQAKTAEAFVLLRKALQDSMDARRKVLEADILISLSVEEQMKGNNQQALDLVTRALALTAKTGNLYGKARGLGELTRLKLLVGKSDEASNAIDEALRIDKLNGFKFEALHLVYKSWLLGVTGKDNEAIDSLVQARTEALLVRDTNAFLSAEKSYAFVSARKGKADEAIRQLDLLRIGDLNEFTTDSKNRECLAYALRLPVFRVSLLEGFASVLETVNQKDKEIEIWQELYAVSQEQGFLAGEAEAKQKLADLENALKRTDEALRDYAEAADLYRKLQNDSSFDQVVFAESLLLLNSGRGKEAIPLVEEVANYAKQHGLREIEFASYMMQAGIYQKAGDTGKTRDALEKAIILVRPGPFDEKIDNHTVHLAYVSLSDIYRAAALPTEELISIDRAFFVSFHLKDEKSQQAEVQYLDQRLKDLNIRDLVEQREKEGRLAESLIFSCILHLRDGQPPKPAEDANLQRIFNLPFQLAQTPGGAAELTEILLEVGPMLATEKLALVDALARYYATNGSDALLAEKYANDALSMVEGLKGDLSALRAEPTCILALSYSRQGKYADAEQKSAECLALAEKANDEQTMIRAEAATIMVHAQTGNIAAAKSSLEGLIKKAPDNPELFVELARSMASAQLYDQANAEIDSAVKKFLSAGDKKAAAGAYARTALALVSDSSETAKKLLLEYLNTAVRLYQEVGAVTEEAATLVVMGDYFLGVAQYDRAIEHYLRAQDLAQKAKQQNIVAQALLGLGNVYQAQGGFAKAQDYHGRAWALFQEVNNAVGETISLRNLGRDSYELGQLDKALSELLDARRTANNAGTVNQYFADYSLGLFYQSQGQFAKAQASFRDAVKITNEAEDLEHCAYSHLAISSLDTLIGRWEDAIAESETALAIFEKIGNKSGQSDCWAELTTIYSDRSSALKDFNKAQECYKRALELGYGKTLELDLLEIYLQTGKYSEAGNIATESIENCRKEKNTDCLAHGLISFAEAEGLRGHLKESRASLNDARPLASKSADLYLRARFMYAESRLLKLEHRFDDSLASYRQLISLIESVKGKLEPLEQKSLSENYTYIYDELVFLLYSMSKQTPKNETRFASEALEYAEKNKARQFADTWGQMFTLQMRHSLPVSIEERELALYSQRDRLTAKVEAASESLEPGKRETKATLETELSSVESQIQSFVTDLRRVSPQYAAIAYPEEIQISTLPLRKGETLVEFKMTEDSTFAWIIRGQNGTNSELAAFYEIPRNRSWFLERLSAVRKTLNAGHAEAVDWGISEELFASLFPPEVEKIIVNSSEIIFIPDDALFVLPFELFSPRASKGDFVFLRKPTTYYPSAVSLRLARTATHPSNWQSAFLGIADPITSPEDERFEVAQALKSSEKNSVLGAQNLPNDELKQAPDPDKLKSRGFSFERLPGTAAEVQSIASLLRERREVAEVRLGVNATKNELLDTDLSRFRFLHFATHGVLPVDTGVQEPSLVLSYDGITPDHMFLSMSEILNLKLQSESVVLSACNTGSGKISRAEGVMSLGRAFLAAGSASVTVSLWQVSDESTALLMEIYYKNLLDGKKKSVALAEARNAVFASGSKSPYFWGPFIVIGE